MRVLVGVVMALCCSAHLVPSASAQAVSTRKSRALDHIEIAELGARFDNALDSEDAEAFAATFAPHGVLAGFWGEAKGRDAVKGAHAFMLATFARDKRHVVTNHVIEVRGDQATMYSYLTVFDRKALAVTGTATFTDTLQRRPEGWRFTRRVLAADPNVAPIIEALRAKN